MIVSYVDQRPAVEWSATVSTSGDVLTINGTAMDFSDMADGDRYPAAALDQTVFAADVTKADGEITATLFRPVDRDGVPLTGVGKTISITIDNGNIQRAADIAAAALAEARAQMRLSPTQLIIGLVSEGWITQAEGDAWTSGGPLPAAALGVIASLPTDALKFAAKTRMLKMTTVDRTDPLVAALAAAVSKTDAEIDTFFATYAAV